MHFFVIVNYLSTVNGIPNLFAAAATFSSVAASSSSSLTKTSLISFAGVTALPDTEVEAAEDEDDMTVAGDSRPPVENGEAIGEQTGIKRQSTFHGNKLIFRLFGRNFGEL